MESEQKRRIRALGYTMGGFAALLAAKHPDPLFSISPFSVARAVHRSRGTRAERWVGEKIDELLAEEEARRARR